MAHWLNASKLWLSKKICFNHEMYSPVRTITLSRMDKIRVVALYPCIMIISHLDTLNPASCHRPVVPCTIFFCLAVARPACRQLPPRRRLASFTGVLGFNVTRRAPLEPGLRVQSTDWKLSRRERAATCRWRGKKLDPSDTSYRCSIFPKDKEPFIAFPFVWCDCFCRSLLAPID